MVQAQQSVNKTKMIADFRKAHPADFRLNISGSAAEIIESTKFLGVHITEKLT